MEKILLAVCDAFLINIYSSQLRKSGYSISVVPAGEIAINRIKNVRPDLLVLDASLPNSAGRDGLSVLRALREDSDLKELKVVMLLDLDKEEDIKNSIDLGVIKCLAKAENTSEDIVEEIKRILS